MFDNVCIIFLSNIAKLSHLKTHILHIRIEEYKKTFLPMCQIASQIRVITITFYIGFSMAWSIQHPKMSFSWGSI